MPSNKAVVDVIEQWSSQRPEKMSQSLEDWWNQTAPGSSHSALSFDPDGIEDLIKRIKNAFPSSMNIHPWIPLAARKSCALFSSTFALEEPTPWISTTQARVGKPLQCVSSLTIRWGSEPPM
jgi:hypothetical protein